MALKTLATRSNPKTVLPATIETPGHLSWSAVSSYADCGERYRIERGFKLRKSTWFATLAGSVIHSVTEDFDRALHVGLSFADALAMTPAFQPLFDAAIAEALDEGLEIKASGRKTAGPGFTEYGGPDKKNYAWYLEYGPRFVARYMAWRAASGWAIASVPDGRPGIELSFECTLGGERVVGYVDRLFETPTGQLIVLDLKTGKAPAGSLQLVTYHLGMLESYGLDVPWGTFWTPAPPAKKEGSPDTGRLSDLVDLHGFSAERMGNMYASLMRGFRANVFVPSVSNMCVGCSVRDYCWAVQGKDAGEVPAVAEVVARGTGELVAGATPAIASTEGG